MNKKKDRQNNTFHILSLIKFSINLFKSFLQFDDLSYIEFI